MTLYVVFNFYDASAYLKNMLCLATSSEEPCFIELDNSLIKNITIRRLRSSSLLIIITIIIIIITDEGLSYRSKAMR